MRRACECAQASWSPPNCPCRRKPREAFDRYVNPWSEEKCPPRWLCDNCSVDFERVDTPLAGAES